LRPNPTLKAHGEQIIGSKGSHYLVKDHAWLLGEKLSIRRKKRKRGSYGEGGKL